MDMHTVHIANSIQYTIYTIKHKTLGNLFCDQTIQARKELGIMSSDNKLPIITSAN